MGQRWCDWNRLPIGAVGRAVEIMLAGRDSVRATHLQQVGELRVAVGDVGGLGGQRAKDVAQRGEALVDGARLLLPLPRHLAAAQPLAAGGTAVHKSAAEQQSQKASGFAGHVCRWSCYEVA